MVSTQLSSLETGFYDLLNTRLFYDWKTLGHYNIELAWCWDSHCKCNSKQVFNTGFCEFQTSSPLVVFGMLPHEQKMSVVNFVVKKLPGSVDVIQSKERLIFHCGYRRFAACPIFSQVKSSVGDLFLYIFSRTA